VIRYILNVDDEIQDTEMIATKIQRCSLLLFGVEEEGSGYIRVHQIVSDVIDSLVIDFPIAQQLQTLDVAIISFIQFVEDDLSIGWYDPDSLEYSKHIVPHLRTLIFNNENLFHEQDLKSNINTFQDYLSSFPKLGNMCLSHDVLDAAMKYFGLALRFAQRVGGYDERCGRVLQ